VNGLDIGELADLMLLDPSKEAARAGEFLLNRTGFPGGKFV
jgi:hypothetical protein